MILPFLFVWQSKRKILGANFIASPNFPQNYGKLAKTTNPPHFSGVLRKFGRNIKIWNFEAGGELQVSFRIVQYRSSIVQNRSVSFKYRSESFSIVQVSFRIVQNRSSIVRYRSESFSIVQPFWAQKIFFWNVFVQIQADCSKIPKLCQKFVPETFWALPVRYGPWALWLYLGFLNKDDNVTMRVSSRIARIKPAASVIPVFVMVLQCSRHRLARLFQRC